MFLPGTEETKPTVMQQKQTFIRNTKILQQKINNKFALYGLETEQALFYSSWSPHATIAGGGRGLRHKSTLPRPLQATPCGSVAFLICQKGNHYTYTGWPKTWAISHHESKGAIYFTV